MSQKDMIVMEIVCIELVSSIQFSYNRCHVITFNI